VFRACGFGFGVLAIGCMIQDLGFEVSLGFRVKRIEFRVLGFGVSGLGVGVWDSGSGVWDLG